MSTALLISLIVLIVLIAFIVWWYAFREQPQHDEEQQDEDKKPAAFSAPGYKDDLTVIDGIGETLQRKLNGLGITTFKQIAELTEADIARINATLSFKGRIQREGWVVQARKLVEAGARPQAGGNTHKAPGKKASRKQGGRGTKTRKTSTGKAGKKTKKKARKSS